MLASLTADRYRPGRHRPCGEATDVAGANCEVMFRIVLSLIVGVGVAYFSITALCGYELGRQINKAKANPLVAIGAQMVGRNETEAFAIHKAKFPAFITESPSFWLLLRQSE
jgi:hypothetical protein